MGIGKPSRWNNNNKRMLCECTTNENNGIECLLASKRPFFFKDKCPKQQSLMKRDYFVTSRKR